MDKPPPSPRKSGKMQKTDSARAQVSQAPKAPPPAEEIAHDEERPGKTSEKKRRVRSKSGEKKTSGKRVAEQESPEKMVDEKRRSGSSKSLKKAKTSDKQISGDEMKLQTEQSAGQDKGVDRSLTPSPVSPDAERSPEAEMRTNSDGEELKAEKPDKSTKRKKRRKRKKPHGDESSPVSSGAETSPEAGMRSREDEGVDRSLTPSPVSPDAEISPEAEMPANSDGEELKAEKPDGSTKHKKRRKRKKPHGDESSPVSSGAETSPEAGMRSREDEGVDRSLTPSPVSPDAEISPEAEMPANSDGEELKAEKPDKSTKRKKRRKQKKPHGDLSSIYGHPEKVYEPIEFDPEMDPFMANATIELDSQLNIPDSEITILRVKQMKKARKGGTVEQFTVLFSF